MPRAEISISIRVDPKGDPRDHGISGDAEVIVDEIFYIGDKDLDVVYGAAAHALEEAAGLCNVRADDAADQRYEQLMKDREKRVANE